MSAQSRTEPATPVPRAELIDRGVDVSETYHFTGLGGARVPGPDPEGRSYSTLASFRV